MVDLVTVGVLVLAASLYAAYKLRQKNKALIRALEKAAQQKEAEATSYELPPQDEKVIEDCKDMLKSEFPLGVAETMKHMNLEDRKKCMERLTMKGGSIMGVNPVTVQFNEDPQCSGGYCNENNTITYSLVFLCSDDDIATSINTVFHELRHKMQYYAVEKGNPQGYRKELVRKWKSEFNEYISHIVSPRLYYWQIIERDARLFADNIYKA